MPNWCYNNLDITANTPEQKEMLERVSRAEPAEGFISLFMPLPEILKDTTSPTPQNIDEVQQQTMIAQTGFDNWYDWQVHNWGTKWDPEVMSADWDGETLSVSFDSAWAPPIAFYEWLQEQGYTVYANYYEPGMDYGGFYEDGDDRYMEDVSNTARQDESEWTEDFRELDSIYGIAEDIAMWDENEEELVDD
jgi:hypothetical protein